MEEARTASGLCLALDFGGTKLAAGLVDWRTGEVLRQARCATAGSRGARGQIADMLGLVEGELGFSADRPAIDAVGVSFGGPVDAARGIVLQSHHVEGWDGLPLAAELGAAFGCPVHLENDANAVALGEHRYGAGRGARAMVYITVSTGIGGGIVVEGQLWRGSHGVAGEVGHMVVRPGGPVCTCGNRGCLESLASGPSIARRAREALAAGGEGSRTADGGGSRTASGGGSRTAGRGGSRTAGRGGSRTAPTVLAIAGSEDAITAEHVFRAARAGDPLAAQVVAAAAEDLGLAIAMLASIVDPERVILGGGVAKAGEQLLAPVRAAFARYAFPMLAERVGIVRAAAIDEGGLLGAAALVAQAHA